jgi:hypothetical protein
MRRERWRIGRVGRREVGEGGEREMMMEGGFEVDDDVWDADLADLDLGGLDLDTDFDVKFDERMLRVAMGM